MNGESARENQEAVIFCSYLRIHGPDIRGACTAMAPSCKFGKGGPAGDIHEFDARDPRARSMALTCGSAENNSRVMMA